MRQRNLYIILIFSMLVATGYAQLDSIQQLPEVMLTDSKLIHFSKGYKLEKLQDSIVDRNSASLTETLRYNTSIYFKENGWGMVSSPSFRGTNAAQTAVIWNGININSVFTGQTDFNVISPSNYSEITIRSGGGGVQYGSGAVGGSIHLNDTYSFKKNSTTDVGVRYGSFSTVGGRASTTQIWDDHYVNVGVDFISSENDYEYVDKNRKNDHGQFRRFVAKINEARKLKRGASTWNSEYSYSNRNFSGSLHTSGQDAYKDIATRNLWQLRQRFGKFSLKGSVAHLFEQYNYFPESGKPLNTQGKAHTFIGAIQSGVSLLKKLRLNGKLEYTFVEAEGDNVGHNSRKTLATVLLLNHKLSEKFNYGINFRQEFFNGFDNPFLIAADAKYQISKNYALRLNGSKNYRVPTFNDLFWYAGGNDALQPETSYQAELGHELIIRNLRADVATYYIYSQDLIKWVPSGGGIWQPVNINKTRNYGIEAALGYFIKLKSAHSFDVSGNYSYTKSEDLQREKQLMYVPLHKASANFEYAYNKFSFYIQGLYNGRAYTTTDNSEYVNAYHIFNTGLQYTLGGAPKITLGGRLHNVFNTYYENVAYRPMPSRNIEIFVNLKI